MRLVDADALKNRLMALVRGGTNLNYCIADMIDRAPTIEPERKRGKWKKTYLDHEAMGERPSIFIVRYAINVLPIQ